MSRDDTMVLLDTLCASREAVTFPEGISYGEFIWTGRRSSPF